MKKGYIFITSSGYDPERGKNIKDPYLGDVPTFGACMPNIRRQVVAGDHIFVISGKLRRASPVQQYVVGGFEVVEKIDALTAYRRFPALRLRNNDDGQLDGNVIVDSKGKQHHLDGHSGFERRIENYIVGRDTVALVTPDEVARGRRETLEVLRSLFGKLGTTPHGVIGRCSKLDENQVLALRHWLWSLKSRP